jgi:hypothetical protein
MFSFLRNTSPHQPSVALQQALTQQGLPLGLPANTLRVLTAQGKYAGRAVRYFRVFDPHGAAQGNLTVRTLTERATVMAAPTPNRERADRAAHPDDERLVFWNAEASRSSAAHLSEAASTWLHARSSQAEAVPQLPGLGRA